jgi:hypothetical protein
VRYFEILTEATQQFWDHAAERFQILQQEITIDPHGVIGECVAMIQTLNAITPADPEEELLVEMAVDACDGLIEQANQIINRQP